MFCSFARLEPGDPGAYTMSHEEAWGKLRARVEAGDPITEIHIVNGLHPGLPFDYYTELLAGLKRIQPSIHLKAFTAVEIFYFAKKFGMPIADVLAQLRAAGPRLAAGRRRRDLRARACAGRSATTSAPPTSGSRSTGSPTGWACGPTARCSTARSRPSRSASTTCCGCARCRTRRAGFQTFIPLAFHPDDNALMKLPGPTGIEDLRTYAVARLMLNNIPHIKAYWIMLGVKTAQTALWFGADDLDGTVQEENIYHMAGAETPQAMSPAEIVRIIREAGRTPVERDTLYNVVAEGRRARLRRAVPPRRAPHAGGRVVSKLRVAAVSFLNARPITYGLERGLGDDRIELSLRPPLALRRAARARRGRPRPHPDRRPTRRCRASCASSPASPSPGFGPVRTVLLVGEVPWRRDEARSRSTAPRAARRCCSRS